MAQSINEGWVAGLEDYTPTVSVYYHQKKATPELVLQIPDSLTLDYLMSSGFKTDDPRV